MILSVIIPVYNTAPLLIRKCLDSIMRQKLPETYEIILINDGSDATYSSVYEEICKKNTIRYFYQENKGVSAARNYGLEEAQGKYIMFIDADDSLESLDFCRWIEYMEKNDIEVVSGCIRKKYEDGSTKELTMHSSEEFHVYDNMSAIVQQILARRNATYQELTNVKLAGPYSKIYSRTAIGKIRFDVELKMGEDLLFNFFVYKQIARICIVNTIWYTYNICDNTASNSFSNDLLKRYSLLIEKISACKEMMNSSECQALCNRAIYHFNMVAVLYIRQGDQRLKNFVSVEKEMLNDYGWQRYFDDADMGQFVLKYKILIYLVKHKLYKIVFLYYSIADKLHLFS